MFARDAGSREQKLESLAGSKIIKGPEWLGLNPAGRGSLEQLSETLSGGSEEAGL